MPENEIVYLKYQNLEDMLKVIIYSAQSMLGVVPMLYHISHGGKHVLFIQTGAVGGVTVQVPAGALSQAVTLRIAEDATGAPALPEGEPIAPIYALFTEGFATRDLIEAKRLLDELS